MGFLDDLKRRAEAQQALERVDTATLERNTLLCEAACRGAFSYLDALAAQLRVLRPVAPARYVFDRRTVLERLTTTDVKVDARRKMLRGQEVYDHLVLHGLRRSGRTLQLQLDFLPEIEKLEPKLRQSGAQVDAEAVRHPETGKLQHMHYTVVADVVVRVRLVPDHDRGRILVQATNMDALETLQGELPATELGNTRLDELARWWVGEPHRFLDGLEKLQRQEA